jgi:hypothetical protein
MVMIQELLQEVTMAIQEEGTHHLQQGYYK